MEISVKIRKSNPWTGVTKWKSCFDYIGTYIKRSGVRYTGLSDEDAKRLEKEIGYAEGTLAPSSEFWLTYNIKLGSDGIQLHTENPGDELKYLFLKSHKRVADGVSNITPGTDYVMYNENAEAEKVNKYNQVKIAAIKALAEMTIDEKRKCLRLYGIRGEGMSNDLVETKLYEFVERAPQKFLDTWVNNKTRDTQFLVEEALAKNIVRKNKQAYYYGTDIIGNNMDDAIAYLNDKKNQDIKMIITNETKSK